MSSADAQFPAPKEITDLKWLEGSWTGSGTFAADGQEAVTKITVTFKLEGMFLVGTITNNVMGMEMIEKRYLGWSASKKQYEAYTFTNFAPTPRVERGEMKEGLLVTVSEPWEVGGGFTTGRFTLGKKGDSQLIYRIEFKMGEQWTPVTDLILTKSK